MPKSTQTRMVGIWMITNITGIPTLHTHTAYTSHNTAMSYVSREAAEDVCVM